MADFLLLHLNVDIGVVANNVGSCSDVQWTRSVCCWEEDGEIRVLEHS